MATTMTAQQLTRPSPLETAVRLVHSLAPPPPMVPADASVAASPFEDEAAWGAGAAVPSAPAASAGLSVRADAAAWAPALFLTPSSASSSGAPLAEALAAASQRGRWPGRSGRVPLAALERPAAGSAAGNSKEVRRAARADARRRLEALLETI